jgi:hypothetical protein
MSTSGSERAHVDQISITSRQAKMTKMMLTIVQRCITRLPALRATASRLAVRAGGGGSTQCSDAAGASFAAAGGTA